MTASRPLEVLFVASEVAPFAKTGGLGDAVTGLAHALGRAGARTRIVVPFYRSVRQAGFPLARRLQRLDVAIGGRSFQVGLVEATLPGSGTQVLFLDCPQLYDRPALYGERNVDYPDNADRFALLAYGALEVARTIGPWPDVVHAHDWQGALAPLLFARTGRRVAKVLTIHNLAFQGLFPAQVVPDLGLGWDLFTPEGIEFYGQLSFLKTGILFADRITTVSPRYAQEIRTPEYGCGLDGLLRARAASLRGILNGADYEIWAPQRDPRLPARYDDEDLGGKALCKASLQREVGLPVRAESPLIGVVSRLTDQKGADLLASAAPELLALDIQLCVLGAGVPALENRFVELGRRYPQRASIRIGYDERLAHRIYAGADLFLMPSRFEPCGLGQIYALRYGTIPVVRATGGLDDTVVDYDPKTRTGSGFKFAVPTGRGLVAAVKRAVRAYGDRGAWQELMRRAMRLDHSWSAAARSYLELYALAGSSARPTEPRAGTPTAPP